MDSLDWSRKYEVFNISRLIIQDLGFSVEQINALTEENMTVIAETLGENLVSAAGITVADELKFIVSFYVGDCPTDSQERSGE